MAAISEAILAGRRSFSTVVRATTMQAMALLLALCLPAFPALSAPKEPDFQLVGASQTGRSCCDTSDTTPLIGGRTSPGAMVTVELRKQYDDPEPPRYTDTVTADGKGRFQFQLPEIKRRVNYVTVTATLDGESRGFKRTVVIDTEAPTGTYVLALGPDMRKPAPAKTTTRELTATLSFTFLKDGEANFGLYREDGKQVETRFPRGGTFEILLPENETHTYRLINIDEAGNVGPASEPVTITQTIERTSVGTVDVEKLRKREGFTVEDSLEHDEDFLGQSAAGLGDINGDGFDDIALGSADASYGDGVVVVVYGAPRNRLPSVVDATAMNGKDGFRIEGLGGGVGRSLGGGGDVNADGFADIVISNSDSSTAWVRFGRERSPKVVTYDPEKPDKKTSLRIIGPQAPRFSRFGGSVAIVGDINDDGIDDFAIGEPDGGSAGFAYVIFGRKKGEFPAEMSVLDLDGKNGFRLQGARKGDGAGNLVAAGGDFNADGIDDMLVGASEASPDGRRAAGVVYVVFGRKGKFQKRIDLGDLDGRTGLAIPGALAGDRLGRGTFSGRNSAATAGDVNGDGIDDLVLTAAKAEDSSIARAGFVAFGARKKSFATSLDLKALNGRNGFRTKSSTTPVAGVGDMNKDGFDDVMFMGALEPLSGYILLGQKSFPKLVEFDETKGVSVVRVSNLPGDGTVAPAGDLDQDGRADLLIGSEHTVPDTFGVGGGYVLFGQDWKK